MKPDLEDSVVGYVADAGRLAALDGYGILDTPPEMAFDALVRLASDACAAPVAMITLVASDRQWFKARVGFDEPETPLDRSICVHALPKAETLVIPDLTRDPRTQENFAVTGSSAFRFYAGAPLRSPCGHGIGTLCVIDHEPRADGLTVPQAGLLRALGEQAMALLEARRALRIQREETERLRSSEAFLHGVLAASPDCIKVLNLEGRLEFMNGPGLRVMEVDDFARVAGVFWPGFWTGPAEAEARRAVAAAAAGSEGRFEGWADTLRGVPKLWEVSVTPILSVDGRPERLLAVSRDRTAERQAAARQAALTDLGERLREAVDADTIAAIVAEAAGRALCLARAAYGVVDRTESEIEFQRDWVRLGQRSVVGSHRYADYGRYVDDLRRGQTVAVADVSADPRTAMTRRRSGVSGSAPSSTCRRWRGDGSSACSASTTPGRAPGCRRRSPSPRPQRSVPVSRLSGSPPRNGGTSEPTRSPTASRISSRWCRPSPARLCARPSTWRAQGRSWRAASPPWDSPTTCSSTAR